MRRNTRKKNTAWRVFRWKHFLTEAPCRGKIVTLVREEGILLRFETYYQMKRHPIAADYISGKDSAISRFDSPSPYRSSAHIWAKRAEWLHRSDRPRANRDKVAEAVLAYNRKHNDVPEAIAAAERLRDPNTLVVVGGQQAGLFSGPMLVIYKAVTILLTAKRAEAELGVPVVPVFWIAGEDHDWDEANHTFLVTPPLEVKKLSLAHPPSDKRTSVSRTPVTAEAWETALGQLAESLQDTEFKPMLLKELKRISETASNLTEAFARTISLLFGKHGLVLIDSDDEALRAAEAPMFRELLLRQPELIEALKLGERDVAARGYPLQAEAAADGFQVFLFRDGERKLLFREGADATDRKGTFRLSIDELVRLTETEPSAFSNNALTRPLMQEYVFPTLATVLGPSEIAYWSMLREAFHQFGERTPIIVPRLEFTLLEGTVQKQMEKFELTFGEAWEHLEERRDEWLQAQDVLGLAAKFAHAKEAFADLYRPLVESAASINPGLRKLAETNMGKILEQIDFLENKSTDAMRQQHEAGLRHWERIRLTVAPAKKPQERVVNVFQYINRYGFDWLDELIGQVELDFAAEYRPHDIIYL